MATATVTEAEILRAADELARTAPADFLGRQFDEGLAWVWLPPGCGGRDAAPDLQEAIDRVLIAAGCPRPDVDSNVVGHGMAAPTIAAHGRPDQHARYLRRIFTGEDVWCQLFSEPGAGSDLAGLATRAERDGDQWVINGQKVWTTLGHTARFGLLLARTDPTVPKHKGITCFLIDMTTPGVDVRPLRQMTGDAEFNEVFFADVAVPDGDRLGEVGQGWAVAMTTLMNERVSLGGSVVAPGTGAIAHALRIWSEGPRDDPRLRDRLARLWIDAETLRLMNERSRSLRAAGTPGPEGSLAKVASALLNQRVYNLCVDLLGPQGLLYPPTYAMTRPERATLTEGDPRFLFLRTRANTIEGGSIEVLRNVIAEQVLGLPPEPRTDKHVPWSEVPRS